MRMPSPARLIPESSGSPPGCRAGLFGERREGAMAEKWWTFRAAQFHVAANCPCDSWAQARDLINGKILEGVLPTRYRIGDGAPAPIDPSAWRRDSGRGG